MTEDLNSIRVMLVGDVTHILPHLMESIRQKGIEITTVNIKKPSMDDVFVHYTGHGLREGEPQGYHENSESLGEFK